MVQSLDCFSEISTRKRNEGKKRKYYSSMEHSMAQLRVYTFFPSSCQPSQPHFVPNHSKPPTIQQPEVIVGQTNEQHTSNNNNKKRKNKCGRRKKCFSFRVLLGSSQCYMAGWAGVEREATTESVRIPTPEAKSCKNCVEIRTRNKRLLEKK